MHQRANRPLAGPAARSAGTLVAFSSRGTFHILCRAGAAGAASPGATEQVVPIPGLAVGPATSAAEYRAAGYLRAHSFYSFPPDRSEFAARAHRRMKGDAEWETITQKVAGTEDAYKQMKVSCIIATIPDSPDDPVAQQVCRDMDLSTKLPSDVSSSSSSSNGGGARLVVGTLDVNIGAVLPAEELIGQLPKDGTASTSRAYLSNVCVAAAVRRRGVARALMSEAEAAAVAAGVLYLYVHVVADNAAAGLLYESSGFVVEAEESEAFAHALSRPRRKILRKELVQA